MKGSGRRVVIVPCSGIGKTFGTVSREAAYHVVEEMRPDETRIVALSLLVMGDPEAEAAVSGGPAITIDGCKLACARTMVKERGGEIVRDFDVLDAYRKHRFGKPEGIATLNENGERLARVLAEEVSEAVDAARSLEGRDDA